MVQHQIEDKQYIKGLIINAIRDKRYTVKDIIDYVKVADLSIAKDEIKNAIKELEKEGKIELYEPKFEGSFFQYLFSINTLFTFWLTVIVTGITLLSIYLLSIPIIRIVIGGMFVLFIPGYALINLLFPKMRDVIETIALSIGLSLAIVPLIGLILNYTPLGIRLDPIVIILSITSISMMFAAVYKQYEARSNG